MTDDQDAVLTECHGHILLITLNRPYARNAINFALARGLAAALDRLDGDDALRAAVITGAGGYFCAGMDLKAFATSGEWPVIEGRGFAGICERASDKPLIAAIEGFAFAGGVEIALSCDMLVAARGAKFGIPEVTRGLIAGAGALIRFPKRIPYHLAMQMALTGEPITSERAYELGLVNELCDAGSAAEKALAIAQRIADNAPLAVRTSKRIIRDTQDWTEAEAWRQQEPLNDVVRHSSDANEGATAFAERRKPVWQGK
jgi:enoyl-CoA hydratase